MDGKPLRKPKNIKRGEMINELKENQVIVVGTNLLGKHGGGAAFQAYHHFGLDWGWSEGLCKQTYAFPTLDENLLKRKIDDLKISRDNLYATCFALPEKEFLLTPVGTGIAGFSVKEMKSLFTDPPMNLILPEEFK